MFPRPGQERDSLLSLFKYGRHERIGFQLYTEAVRAAREPFFYETLGVPDTLDGRFDLVGLYASMIIRRLRILPPRGPKIAQSLFDAMFLRHGPHICASSGVGDMSPWAVRRFKRDVGGMPWNGRRQAYEAPLAARGRQMR